MACAVVLAGEVPGGTAEGGGAPEDKDRGGGGSDASTHDLAEAAASLEDRLVQRLAVLHVDTCDRLERRLDEVRDAILERAGLVGLNGRQITLDSRFTAGQPGGAHKGIRYSRGPVEAVAEVGAVGHESPPSHCGDGIAISRVPSGASDGEKQQHQQKHAMHQLQQHKKVQQQHEGPAQRAESDESSKFKREESNTKREDDIDFDAFRSTHNDIATTARIMGVAARHLPVPTRCQRMVGSPVFEAFFAVITITNAIVMGVQADFNAKNKTEDANEVLNMMSVCFTLLFMVELICNMWCEGSKFFKRSDRRGWNMLDLVLVISSLPELVLLLLPTASTALAGANIGQLRLLRILRITRLIRIVRITKIVRFIRALRTLVHQIMSTLKSLVWGLLLLVILMYGFAIIFTQNATALLIDPSQSGLSAEDEVAVVRFWASVPRSMYTLYESVTGGISWDEVVHPISAGGAGSLALFTIYIAFTQLAVLNVLTGVFCQNAIESAQRDQDIVTQAMLQDKKRYSKQLIDLFNEIDQDGSGTVSVEEFELHLQHPQVQAYFDALELDATDAYQFFKLMDIDDGKTIDIDEFVEGCMRLRGGAKGIDLHLLANDQKKFAAQYQEDMLRMQEAFVQLLQGHAVEPPMLTGRGRSSKSRSAFVVKSTTHVAGAGGAECAERKLERCWV